jgi:hypothetical protein
MQPDTMPSLWPLAPGVNEPLTALMQCVFVFETYLSIAPKRFDEFGQSRQSVRRIAPATRVRGLSGSGAWARTRIAGVKVRCVTKVTPPLKRKTPLALPTGLFRKTAQALPSNGLEGGSGLLLSNRSLIHEADYISSRRTRHRSLAGSQIDTRSGRLARNASNECRSAIEAMKRVAVFTLTVGPSSSSATG